MSESQGQRQCQRPLYDRADAILRLDGDASLFAEMAAMFVAESGAYRAALAEALTAARTGSAAGAQSLQREAHTMKSLFATFSCESGRQLALQLEQAAAAGRLESVGELTTEVVSALAELAAALAGEAVPGP